MSRRKGVTEYSWNEQQHSCPVCGLNELSAFEICDCGWQNDPVQFDNPDYPGGANKMSLNEARKAWAEGREVK